MNNSINNIMQSINSSLNETIQVDKSSLNSYESYLKRLETFKVNFFFNQKNSLTKQSKIFVQGVQMVCKAGRFFAN